MQSLTRRWALCLFLPAIGLFSSALLLGQDGEPSPDQLHGSVKLEPPEGAENQDARGFVKLRQRGERMAIHVQVRHLAPGAAHEVTATREVGDAGETETETLGTITTRDGMPPLPSYFKAVLEPPPEPDGGAAGEGDDRDPFRLWRRHLRPRNLALFFRNHEGTELRFRFSVSGLEGQITEAVIDLGNDSTIPLELDERLRGSVAVDMDQLLALASGEASVSIKTDQGEELQGPIEVCFPILEKIRAHIAERRAGSGALRLDTERDDKMPFDVMSLADLAGVEIRVSDGDGNVVLAGTIPELREIGRRRFSFLEFLERLFDFLRGLGLDPAEDGEDEEVLALTDNEEFFGISEPHDASFIRGDCNDDGLFNIADPIVGLRYLFQRGELPYCHDAADANDDGRLDISDPVMMLQALFLDERGLSPQHHRLRTLTRGFDTTPDTFSCGSAGE